MGSEYHYDDQLGATIGYHLEKLGDRLVAVLKPGPCIVCGVASGNSTKALSAILTAEERVLLATALCEGTSSQVTNR